MRHRAAKAKLITYKMELSELLNGGGFQMTIYFKLYCCFLMNE